MASPMSVVGRVVAAVTVAAVLSACGPDNAPPAAGLAPASGPAGSVGAAAARGGDAWCQSIVALTTFLGAGDGFQAALGKPVADGAAKKDRLLALVADMEAKAPEGHEADFAAYNELYAVWADLYATPSPDKAKQLQTMARSDRVRQAQAHLKPDIMAACPGLKDLGF